jgi:hypothetical protein
LRGGAAFLSQQTKHFELSKGQWRLVIEAWLESSSAVETLESADNDDEEEPYCSENARWEAPDPESDHQYTYDAAEEAPSTAPRLTVDTLRAASEARASDEVHDILWRLMQEVDGLKDRESDLLGKLEIAETERAGLIGDLARATRDLGHLRTNVGQVIGKVQRMEQDAAIPSQDIQGSLDALAFEVLDPQGTVQRMKGQIGDLNDKFDSGGGISCHGLTFGSQKEFVNWYKRKNIINHAMFMDAVAVLHSITDVVVSDEQYNKTESRKRRTSSITAWNLRWCRPFTLWRPAVWLAGEW